jgi:hypothetical protein
MRTRFFTNHSEQTLFKKFQGVFESNNDIERFDALVGCREIELIREYRTCLVANVVTAQLGVCATVSLPADLPIAKAITGIAADDGRSRGIVENETEVEEMKL